MKNAKNLYKNQSLKLTVANHIGVIKEEKNVKYVFTKAALEG